LFLVVSTSAINCLERLVSEMTCYVSNEMLNPTHSLTHFLAVHVHLCVSAIAIKGSYVGFSESVTQWSKQRN